MTLQKMFNPKSIAIVGASEEEGKVGNVIAKNILTLGYSGKVFLVNPKHDQLFSKKCYHNLSDIEEEIDLAIFAIPAKFVTDEIDKNVGRITNCVIVSAGFSEIGVKGREREEALLKIAKEKSLNILGPNCLGFIIPELKLNASFAGGMPESGNIAFVSQSGALAVAMMDRAKKENMNFSGVFSVGNKMQLGESELLDYLEKDEKTKVVGMYLEGIKNGESFIRAAKRVSRKKPIVILKAGKTAKTQEAISSHTGALSGSDDIVSAAFSEAGILRAENLEEFLELLNFISQNDLPENNQVAVVTNAGGAGVLITDAFKDKDLSLWEPLPKEKEEMKKFLPEESSVNNPVDVLGDAKADRYQNILEQIGKNPRLGAVIIILTPQDQTPVSEISKVIVEFKKQTQKTVIAVFIGGERVADSMEKMKADGISVFSFPERAIEVLNDYWKWKIFSEIKIGKGVDFSINNSRRKTVLGFLNQAKKDGRKALSFLEAKKVMELYRILTIDAVEILPEKEFSGILEYPVVLKVDSDKILHKTDQGGLILNIENEDQLKSEIEKMGQKFPGEKMIAQSMAKRELELILGIKRDLIFGPVVVYGLGGIYTEVFKLVDFILPPLELEAVKKKLSAGRLRFLFEGARGQAPYDLDEVASVIRGIGEFALENPEVAEFDINPMLFYNDGKKGMAVDIKIIF